METQGVSQPTENSPVFTERAVRWLGIILAIGCLVRLMAAYIQPAFIDEGYVYYVAKSGPSQAIETLKIDAHPPTFNILVYPLVVSTANIFLLRLPMVGISIMTVFFSFLLLRRFYGETDSLLLTALYALSYELIITDAQLRTYGPLTWCLSAVWLGMLDIYRSGSPYPSFARLPLCVRWGLFFLCGCAGACLHYLGVLSLAACALCSLFLPRGVRGSAFCCLAGGALPACFWLAWCRLTSGFVGEPIPAGFTMSHFNSVFNIPLQLLNLDASLLPLLFGSAAGGEFIKYAAHYVLCPLGAAALWVGFGLGWYRLAKQRAWEVSFLGLNLLFPPCALFAACVLGKLAYSQTRYALPMTVPFIIVLFYGLNQVSRRQAQCFFLGFSALLMACFPFCPALWNQSWRDTLSYLESIKRPNDIIAVCPAYTGYSFALDYDPEHIAFEFYEGYQVRMVQQPSPGKTPVFLLDPKMAGPELLKDLCGYRLILLMCQEKAYKESAALLFWLDRYYTLVGEHHFDSINDWADVNTYVLERKP
ncbi:hypothetical protein IJT17_05255 [bacterium]|nr:hypothetical protein [bacterium]